MSTTLVLPLFTWDFVYICISPHSGRWIEEDTYDSALNVHTRSALNVIVRFCAPLQKYEQPS